jgi:hypothetical protein
MTLNRTVQSPTERHQEDGNGGKKLERSEEIKIAGLCHIKWK